MATEGDRNQQLGTGSPKQNWRSRIDPRHSQNNVPVLFRLKNLQRVAADSSDEPNLPVMPSNPSGKTPPHDSDRNRPIGSTKASQSQVPSSISKDPRQPSGKPDPVTARASTAFRTALFF